MAILLYNLKLMDTSVRQAMFHNSENILAPFLAKANRLIKAMFLIVVIDVKLDLKKATRSLYMTQRIHERYLDGKSRIDPVQSQHTAMKNVPGSIGTSASIALRLGQAVFSSSSIFFMSLGVGFYSYTAFCFLVTIMGLVIPWSFTLALLDGYSILAKFPIRQSGILQVIIVGDLVLSILTLAAASSAASIADLLLKADVSFCPPRLCSRYQISAAMAFLSWFLSLTSSLSNLWLLPSVDAD